MVSTPIINNKLHTLNLVLGGLMRRYKARVPDVGGIIKTMIEAGLIERETDIENDHIAFRTMGIDRLGIPSLEKVFLHYGYQKRDRYNFEQKKLTAYWYEPPTPDYPRIFISELRIHELSAEAQAIIQAYTDEVRADPVDRLDLDDGLAVDAFLHQPLWRRPTQQDYDRLSAESEYAAWVIYNRYYLNHFTISVHNLPPGYNTILHFNDFLEAHGFRLNNAGGKVKVSGDGKLVQSSTVAEMVEAEFSDGQGGLIRQIIAGSYVEFAERRVLDRFAHLPPHQIERRHRRDGFDPESANNIFESTYRHQTDRRGERFPRR